MAVLSFTENGRQVAFEINLAGEHTGLDIVSNLLDLTEEINAGEKIAFWGVGKVPDITMEFKAGNDAIDKAQSILRDNRDRFLTFIGQPSSYDERCCRSIRNFQMASELDSLLVYCTAKLLLTAAHASPVGTVVGAMRSELVMVMVADSAKVSVSKRVLVMLSVCAATRDKLTARPITTENFILTSAFPGGRMST